MFWRNQPHELKQLLKVNNNSSTRKKNRHEHYCVVRKSIEKEEILTSLMFAGL